MKKTCTQCSASFEITKDDLAFYDKISPQFGGNTYSVPPPTLCADCRMQRRLAFRNEQSLYHRQCSKTGKSIISLYSPDVPFPVYDNEEWWKDSWDAKEYGREVDLSRPFLQQFLDCWNAVPKMARIQQGENQNAQYTNCASNNKNCFMLFSANSDEDCLYGNYVNKSRSCIDNLGLLECELCLESINCERCYDGVYLQNCVDCSDSKFLKDCIGCSQCFGCINLRNKKYHIFNEEHSKQDYEKKLSELQMGNPVTLAGVREIVVKFFLQHPHRAYQGVNNENVSGNYILHSKNALECYDTEYCEDCKYCVGLQYARDARDVCHYGCTANNELLYECEGVGHGAAAVLFSKLVWGGSHDVSYSYECFSSHHLLGCAGLRKAEYCILNKQYTKDAYEKLVPKIIERMKKDGEWGEFFPVSMSPFGFNETLGHEYWPISAGEASVRGWKWTVTQEEEKYMGPEHSLPENVQDASPAVCEQIHRCESSGQLYKITPQELQFYQRVNIALPRICYRERHRERLQKRNPRKLWQRTCAKCSKDIQTTYSPERPEIVYCEECYLKTVY